MIAKHIAKRNRHILLTLARKHKNEAVAKAKLELQPQREAVCLEVPFTSWSGFLRHEAENGNEVALAVLRSSKEAVEPERPSEIAADAAKAPVKDWSRHGLDYAAKPAIRADYAEKERVLLERDDLSASGKRHLQAFLRMEEIAAEAKAQGRDLGTIKRRIDGKGVVVFTLGSGGSIRDAGKEVIFSPQDKAAQVIAALYAAKKWGKDIQIEGNLITRSREQEREREQARREELER